MGFNKKANEKWGDYIKRVSACDFIYRTKDSGLLDLTPFKMKDINAKLKVYDHTYYFSLATGLRDKKFSKPREIFKAPQ
jgi:hypothetical protein